MGGILCGRNSVWEESCGRNPVGGIPCGRKPTGEESRGRNPLGGIPCGRNPMGKESRLGGIPWGRKPMGGIPNGRNPMGGIPWKEFHGRNSAWEESRWNPVSWVTLHAKMAMSDFQKYPKQLCLIKYELDIHVLSLQTVYFHLCSLCKNCTFLACKKQ